MRRSVKTLLLWLLLLALPLQGFASATRAVLDGAAAPLAMPMPNMTAVTEMPAHDMAHMPSPHLHDHAAMMTATDQADGHHASHGGHQDSKCHSACAACCIGAAIPQAIVFRSATLAVTHVMPCASLPVNGHIPALPERPPQPVFS